MADFFSKLKKNIDKGAKVITTKSNSAIETTKVKSELNGLKKSKNETFASIGKKVYDSVLLGEFSVELVQEDIAALKEFDATILEKEAELERIKADADAKLEEINAASNVVDVEASEVVEEAVDEFEEEKDVEIQETDDKF